MLKKRKWQERVLQFHVGVIDKQQQFPEQQSWVEDRSSECYLVSGWSFIQDLITFMTSDGICDRGMSVTTCALVISLTDAAKTPNKSDLRKAGLICCQLHRVQSAMMGRHGSRNREQLAALHLHSGFRQQWMLVLTSFSFHSV